MPRYVIEREFTGELHLPTDELGEANRNENVFWLHSYVSTDKKKTFCIYEAPSPEAIRRAANRNKLPLTRITEVLVLDPFYYR
jgi:hypothetical protein